MLEIDHAVQDFLNYLSFERHYSPNTVRNYSSALQRFFNFLKEQNSGIDLQSIERSQIRSFIQYLHKEEYKPKTIHLDLCGVRSFFHYLEMNNILLPNPCTDIESIKLPQTAPNPFREEELDQFFSVIDTSKPSGKRNYVIFQLALHTGLRASEIIALTIHDIALTDAVLYVRQGKGKKDRVLPLSQRTCQLLEEYITLTRPILVDGHDIEALFVTEKHKPMWQHSIRMFAHKYAKKAGLTYRKASPHIFRYSFSTLVMRKSNVSITVLQELLGHENIQTTARYVGVSEEDKRKAVEGLD